MLSLPKANWADGQTDRQTGGRAQVSIVMHAHPKTVSMQQVIHWCEFWELIYNLRHAKHWRFCLAIFSTSRTISQPHELGSVYHLLHWNHVVKPVILHTPLFEDNKFDSNTYISCQNIFLLFQQINYWTCWTLDLVLDTKGFQDIVKKVTWWHGEHGNSIFI